MYQQQQTMMGYTNANLLQTSAPGNVATGPSQTADSGTGMRPDQEAGDDTDTNSNQQEQQQQPVQQPYVWGQTPFNQQWNWNLPQFGVPFQFPGTRIGQVFFRITAGIFTNVHTNYHISFIFSLHVCFKGYETYIAPFWRRCAAELIDTVLFSFLLKLYQPDIDLRYVSDFFFHIAPYGNIVS